MNSFFLLIFIIHEKIELFMTIKNLNFSRYAAIFSPENKSVVVNCEFVQDIDAMCSALTHELIHYLQYKEGEKVYVLYIEKQVELLPLNIEISDEIVKAVSQAYKNNYESDLLMELEAFTFQDYPYFIREYKKNRSHFIPTRKRKKTIKWICQNRTLPTYSLDSENSNQIEFPLKKNSSSNKLVVNNIDLGSKKTT